MRRLPIARVIRETFEKWLSWPEYDIVDIVGATIVANRLEGEPLWLAIVGPSSSGKTELVRALDGLDRIHFLDRITPATFVSGYREAGVKLKGNGKLPQFGLLGKMMDGRPHIIVVEDFSQVFGMRRELRGEVMGELRKLYDGRYTPGFGNRVDFEWRGKLGFIACSTGAYDREMGAQAKFGDRFLVVRSPEGDPVHTAERAGRNASNIKKMRRELKGAFGNLDKLKLPRKEVKLSLDVRTLVSRLTAFVARARSVVPRDAYKREVEALPEIEGTGRMSTQFHQLMRALVIYREIDEATEDEIETVERVAFGTIPTIRVEVMKQFEPKGVTNAMGISGIPSSVLYRTLQDLHLLELITWAKPRAGQGVKGEYAVPEEWQKFFWMLKQR